MEIQSRNSAAILTFDDDPSPPRLTRTLLRQLSQRLEAVRQAGCFGGVVIASNAWSFAAGADLHEIAALDGVAARRFAEIGQELFATIEQCPLPVVAAIRGFCMGGGLDLALACGARVAAYGATFSHPGPALGLMTGWGGTQRLPRLVGRAEALRMLLTGEPIPATQALTLGLADELVPSAELIDAAVRQVLRQTRPSKLGG
ncbi:MAG TPA: enoyl-CoA hydratase/isomerase family protein [Terriglobia bacterium]|nr:enoyl-CoA hydratase/isomerase family protein [Terriglobia bacterium]